MLTASRSLTGPRRPAAVAPSPRQAVNASKVSSIRHTAQRQAPVPAEPQQPVASTSGRGAEAQATAVDYFATDKRPIILFDGVCNLCNGGVNLMLDWDVDGAFRFAALQSGPGRQLLARCGRLPDDISSIVLVEQGSHHIRSDAILHIAQRLRLPLPLLAGLALLVPRAIRDPLYDQVANNRYSFFGRSAACRLSDDGFADRFLGA